MTRKLTEQPIMFDHHSIMCFTEEGRDTYTFKQQRDFGGNVHKLFGPKVIFGIAKQLDECDQSPPRMWPVDYETLEKDLGHDFSEAIGLYFQKEME